MRALGADGAPCDKACSGAGGLLKNGTRLLAYDEIALDSDTGRTTTVIDDEDDFDEDSGLVPQPAE